MACSKPTVSTPLDANIKINRNGKNLFASTTEEWVNSILEVYDNYDYYKNVGYDNYKIFKKYYSIESNYQSYIYIFYNVINRNY